MTVTSHPGGPGEDAITEREALRRRYREERDKRLRPDGNARYLRRSAFLSMTPGWSRTPGSGRAGSPVMVMRAPGRRGRR